MIVSEAPMVSSSRRAMAMPDPTQPPAPHSRTALERLVEIDDANSINGADPDTTAWTDAIAAARTALAQPEGEGPPQAGKVEP